MAIPLNAVSPARSSLTSGSALHTANVSQVMISSACLFRAAIRWCVIPPEIMAKKSSFVRRGRRTSRTWIASPVSSLPDRPEWTYEIKVDGYLPGCSSFSHTGIECGLANVAMIRRLGLDGRIQLKPNISEPARRGNTSSTLIEVETYKSRVTVGTVSHPIRPRDNGRRPNQYAVRGKSQLR
jgi:hypothetical protein